MRPIHIFLLFISVSAFVACENEPYDAYSYDLGLDQVEPDTFIINNYSLDARDLYFNEIFSDTSHPAYYESELDQEEIQEVLKIIQTVYDIRSGLTEDLFETQRIHGRYCFSYNSLMLQVDTAQAAIKNLAEGIIPTGDDNLDSILETYQIDSVRKFYNFPEFNWLSLFSSREQNMIPVERDLAALSQIELAEYSHGCVGDGGTIELTREHDEALITFSMGSGDCPAGCISHEYWEFRVRKGKASFVRKYSD